MTKQYYFNQTIIFVRRFGIDSERLKVLFELYNILCPIKHAFIEQLKTACINAVLRTSQERWEWYMQNIAREHKLVYTPVEKWSI